MTPYQEKSISMPFTWLLSLAHIQTTRWYRLLSNVFTLGAMIDCRIFLFLDACSQGIGLENMPTLLLLECWVKAVWCQYSWSWIPFGWNPWWLRWCGCRENQAGSGTVIKVMAAVMSQKMIATRELAQSLVYHNWMYKLQCSKFNTYLFFSSHPTIRARYSWQPLFELYISITADIGQSTNIFI